MKASVSTVNVMKSKFMAMIGLTYNVRVSLYNCFFSDDTLISVDQGNIVTHDVSSGKKDVLFAKTSLVSTK